MSVRGLLKYAYDSLLRRSFPMLEKGTQAPDFSATDHHGRPIRLSDYRGKKVVLWFFPKADTPG